MIPIYETDLGFGEKENLERCLKDNFISSQGEFVSSFEREFSRLHSMEYGIAVSNCTNGIHLALLGLGVGHGDEVVCPALTFIAPINMVRLTGAKAVLCDVDNDSWCIDPKKLEACLTPSTKAVIVVHAFGLMADLEAIKTICDKNGIFLIEDNAEAPFSHSGDMLSGTVGDVSIFSFFANKVFTTGEGGMVLTNSDKLAGKMRLIRDHGMSATRRYVHVEVGTNYRMTNLQAAIGCAQLDRRVEILKVRKRQDTLYRDHISQLNNHIQYRFVSGQGGTHWLATILLASEAEKSIVQQGLRTKGIETRPMIFPVDQAPVYFGYFSGTYPTAELVSSRALHLPSSNLILEEHIQFIVTSIGESISSA